MRDVEVDRDARTINFLALTEQLRHELDCFGGLSIGPHGATVHLSDESTADDVATAVHIVQVHNPTDQSSEQVEEEMEREILDEWRQVSPPLSEEDYNEEPVLIHTLAVKVAHLEAEINWLRKGWPE